MGWLIFGLSIAASFALAEAITRRQKIKIWASKKTANSQIEKQKNEGAIFVESEKIVAFNAFTDTLNETFKNGRWRVREAPFLVRYIARNRLGRIVGLTVRFDVYMNGIHVEYFEKSVPSIKADEEIELNVGIDNSLDLLSELRKEAGLPKKALVSFNVDVRSYEFYIPRDNPLYEHDDVRDAVGMPRAKKDRTALEEYAELTADLSDTLKKQTDSIMTNIKKMDNLASDNPELRNQVVRFTEKYVPLINDVLRVYKNRTPSEVGSEDVIQTMRNMVNGSEIFLKKLQSKDKMNSEVAMTVIEQQLMADGLMDHFEVGTEYFKENK